MSNASPPNAPAGVRDTQDPLIVRLLQSSSAIDADALMRLYDDVAMHADPETALIQSGLVSQQQIAAAYSNHYLLPLYDPPNELFDSIDTNVAGLLDADFCCRNRLVPLADDGNTIDIAIDCPDGLLLAEEIREKTGRQMRPMFATASVVSAAIVRLYQMTDFASDGPVLFEQLGSSPTRDQTIVQQPSADRSERHPDFESRSDSGASNSNQNLQRLIDRVEELRGDNIHIEHTETSSRIRVRIDGCLVPIEPPVSVYRVVDELQRATKWKSPRRESEIESPSTSGPIRIRVHCCNVVGGQTWTLQMVRNPITPPPLGALDLDPTERADLHRGIDKTRGLIIVSGPCDSGKSETLYSILRTIVKPQLNVFTVEQNLRYSIDGINQTLVDDSDPFALHDHLQSVLDQDPDVLLVHQIRDAATADLCVRAAEGGRRVLMTIPSADCQSALRHLESLGISAHRIGETVRSVVAQRRVRRLCERCKIPHQIPPGAYARLGLRGGARLFEAGGCEHCLQTGFVGRLTGYEVLRLNTRLSNPLRNHGEMPNENSLPPGLLRQRLMRFVETGVTSLEEVRRVL